MAPGPCDYSRKSFPMVLSPSVWAGHRRRDGREGAAAGNGDDRAQNSQHPPGKVTTVQKKEPARETAPLSREPAPCRAASEYPAGRERLRLSSQESLGRALPASVFFSLRRCTGTRTTPHIPGATPAGTVGQYASADGAFHGFLTLHFP